MARLAQLFLSYVREDQVRARALAKLLEEAGHSVWWDRHIKGGAQFALEIEAALASADKVLVLWSAESVKSPWVRDEAAAGRDSGRLVPISLDGSEAPLGFRQYQTIDLSEWRRRKRPAQLDAVLTAIAAEQSMGNATAQPRRRERQPLLSWVIALAALLLVGGAAYLLLRPGSAAATVVVQAGAANPVSTAAALDLSAKLASVAAANASSFRLATAEPGRRVDADLVLRVNGRNDPSSSSRDVTLLRGAKQTLLWAGHFEQPNETAGDLPAQLGASAALVLTCGLDTLAAKQRLPQELVTAYLAGCAKLEDQLDTTATNVTPIFEKVIAQIPSFTPAWDKLLGSEAWRVMWEPGSDFAVPLRNHLAAAAKRKLDVPGLYLARAALRPSNDYAGRIGELEAGLKEYASDARLHSTLASMLTIVGRQEDAIEHALRAAELAPLSPVMRTNYIFILAHSGKYEQAKEELARADRLWPGATALQWTRFSLEMRYGDPHVALKVAREGASRAGQSATEAFLRAKIDPSKANIDQAVNEQVKLNRQAPFFIVNLVQALATFRRTEEAMQVLLSFTAPEYAGYQAEPLFRPTMRALRRDPRFMQGMARMGLAEYWRRSGRWPDFCFEPDLPYDCKKEAARYV